MIIENNNDEMKEDEDIDYTKIEKLKNLKPLNILTGDSLIYLDLINSYKSAFPDYNTIEVFQVSDINVTRPMFDVEQFLCIITINSIEAIKSLLEYLEDKDYIVPIYLTNSVSVFNYIKSKKFTANFNGYFPPYKMFARYCVKRKEGLKDMYLENLYKKLKGDYSQLDLILSGDAKPQKKNISFNRMFFSIINKRGRGRCADLLAEYRYAKKFVLKHLIDNCDRAIKSLSTKNEDEFDLSLETISLERVIEVRCELDSILNNKNNFDTWVIEVLKLMI